MISKHSSSTLRLGSVYEEMLGVLGHELFSGCKEVDGDLARTVSCAQYIPLDQYHTTNGEAKSRRSNLGRSKSSPVSSFGKIPALPSFEMEWLLIVQFR